MALERVFVAVLSSGKGSAAAMIAIWMVKEVVQHTPRDGVDEDKRGRRGGICVRCAQGTGFLIRLDRRIVTR